jgi:hypothetical protein
MPESNDRLTDLGQFYEILHRLDKTIGGSHRLTECSGKMPWPSHGVYFFFEDGEVRSDSGVGPRVVRVGTHALTATSRTTLWNRLSQHRGVTKTGAGNHRGSIFRLIVGEALSKRAPSFGVETWGQGQSAIAAVRATEVEHERRVSDYIRAMPFVWLRVSDDGGGPALRALIERNSIVLVGQNGRAASRGIDRRVLLGSCSILPDRAARTHLVAMG